MIDKVRLKSFVILDETVLRQNHWRKCPMFNKHTKTFTGYCYKYHRRDISFRYHIEKNTLRVEGRFINFSRVANKVYNLDELYAGRLELWFDAEPYGDNKYFYYDADGKLQVEEVDYDYEYTAHGYAQNLDDVLDELSSFLSEVTGATLDIRSFRIEKIEVCFNLDTPYVNEYITHMNMISKGSTDPRYTNYVLERELQLNTSTYIKTKGEYKKNSNQNYTVNFYNKLNQLMFLRSKGKRVTDNDLDLARNILRMEVQVNYRYLKNLFEKHGLDFTTRSFFQFINIDLCAEIIKDKYGYFIDKNLYLDFYSYHAVKELITNSTLTTTVKDNLRNYILKCSRGHKPNSDSEPSRRKKQLAELGIHDCLIPTSWGIDHLPSPMKLLDAKVEDIKHRRSEYMAEEDPYEFFGYYRYQLKQLKTL